MKLAYITDTHFGCKNDAKEFTDQMVGFYENQFFPYLVEHNIKSIIHGGDMFDRRKYTNHETLSRFRTCFFDKLREHDIHMHAIIGNHDTYYKSTNDVNAPNLFLESYNDCITLIQEPTTERFGSTDILMMPWINAENYKQSLKAMKDTPATILIGHFEIRGFAMNRGGSVNTGGLKAEIFKEFDKVLSGHFHEPSTDGQISYLGAPYEYTWADYDCKRGFWVMDSETEQMDHIQNETHMFHRVQFSPAFIKKQLKGFNFESVRGAIVQIIVEDKIDTDLLEQFVNDIEKVNPFTLEVIDNSDYHIAGDDVDEEALKNEDTLGIVGSYIESSEITVDKDKLNEMFKSLYVEAVAVE